MSVFNKPQRGEIFVARKTLSNIVPVGGEDLTYKKHQLLYIIYFSSLKHNYRYCRFINSQHWLCKLTHQLHFLFMKYGFFIFILAFFLSMMAYVIFRGSQALNTSGFWKYVYIGAAITLFAAFITGMIFSHKMTLPVAKSITFLGNSFLIILIYLTLSFLITDFFLLFNKWFSIFKTDVISIRFWGLLLSLGTILIAMFIGNYKFNHPKTVRLEIHSEKNRPHKEIKIVGISDIHLGVSIDKKRLKRYVEMINAEKPDLVLIAGDVIDRSIAPVISQQMDEEFRSIHAPMGIYAVLGNHEYFGEGVELVAHFLQKSGIQLLKDSAVLVQNEFYIAGRDDKINPHRKELSEILQYADSSKPIILLDHQPFNLQEAQQNKVDFQLSGHTHNGQFFPGNLFVKRMFELGYGYKKKGETHYYVSSGLGLWGPQYRIGSQSEMVVVRFRY